MGALGFFLIVGVLFSIVCCTVLVGWIIVLLLTLHRNFTATHWRLAWVGFDIVLLAAFAATGWRSGAAGTAAGFPSLIPQTVRPDRSGNVTAGGEARRRPR